MLVSIPYWQLELWAWVCPAAEQGAEKGVYFAVNAVIRMQTEAGKGVHDWHPVLWAWTCLAAS